MSSINILKKYQFDKSNMPSIHKNNSNDKIKLNLSILTIIERPSFIVNNSTKPHATALIS